MAEPKKRQSPIWYVIGCIGLGILCVPCIGVIAAIAIPALVNYARRAKTAEARVNVAMLQHRVLSACTEGAFPDALPPTLATVDSHQHVPTLDPRWIALGLPSDTTMYYAYMIERPDASSAVIAAEGDLDGDGTRSRYAYTCTQVAGACTCGELVVTNELE